MNGQPLAAVLSVTLAAEPAERLKSLYKTHYRRLVRLARRLAPTADDALDLVQETFLRAARSPKSIPAGASNEEAWLVRVLINIRRDQWRKASIREEYNRRTGCNNPTRSTGGNPESVAIARTTVWQALEVLPPRRRAVVVMSELDGLAVPAIAALLGISAITVRWHLAAGMRDLTKALKTYMGDLHEDG